MNNELYDAHSDMDIINSTSFIYNKSDYDMKFNVSNVTLTNKTYINDDDVTRNIAISVTLGLMILITIVGKLNAYWNLYG